MYGIKPDPNLIIDSITFQNTTAADIENPVVVKASLKIKNEDEELPQILYYNLPLLPLSKDVLFKSEKRRYDVWMQNTLSLMYKFDLTLPAGYTVESLPQNTALELLDGEGQFTAIYDKTDNSVSLMFRVNLNKDYFKVDEYPALRSFFEQTVNKMNEPLVLRKK